jgi:hypothetical protein
MANLTRRRVEREVYDQEKALQLQDDEIERLRSELKMVRRQITLATSNHSQKRSVHERRIADLRKSIAQLPKGTSSRKSAVSVSHTQSIIDLHTRHRQSLDKVRLDYEARLLFPSLAGGEDHFASWADGSVREGLSQLRARIASDRRRAALLESDIHSIIDEAHARAADQRAVLDAIRGRLAEVRARTAELRRRVREAGADELAAAALDLEVVRQAWERMRAASAPLVTAAEARVAEEQCRQRKIAASADRARRTVAGLSAERETLVSEIQSLVFMVNGRAGQHQLSTVALPWADSGSDDNFAAV